VADRVVELGALGKDDQLGTLNLVTPAKRMAALALVLRWVYAAAGGRPVQKRRSQFHPVDPGLGEAAASRNRWEFMLTVNPLALSNATGSSVNAIAVF
jgi:hypothetical protein